jgi:prepilin-type processing-associated H-X9-DG protein
MKRFAFTIIELLVVIAIITAIIGILLPALRALRLQAIALDCSSNLRQISFAMLAYDQENEGFPHGFDSSSLGKKIPPGGYLGSPSRDLQGIWWLNILSDITEQKLDRDSIFWCPSRNVNDSHILCGNYGVNRSICKDALGLMTLESNEFTGAPLASIHINNPSQTLLIADSGYSILSWRASSNAPKPYFTNPRRQGAFYLPGQTFNQKRLSEGTISPYCKDDAISGRHYKKTVNVVFTDGHLSRINADDLFVEEANGIYKNRTPLWMPD